MEIDYVLLGERIRKRRKELKLSQEKLAERIDVSSPHMCNIENGKTKFSLQVLVDLANALETTPNALLADHIDNKDGVQELVLEEIGQVLKSCTPLQMTTLENALRTTQGMLVQYEKKVKKDEY
ncbi:MAG: helix-turn-helix transcriptional regulator [Lachnospiraceae bacterium]|nr:helix-turn-helix transcriptional regulator [Lachnospiraceae bacterium]